MLELVEIECAGSAEEFAEAEIITENARAHWMEGVRNAQKQIGLLLESSAGSAEVRMAAVLKESFEVVSWKGREARLTGLRLSYRMSCESRRKRQSARMRGECQR